jgi:hypothetical protein
MISQPFIAALPVSGWFDRAPRRRFRRSRVVGGVVAGVGMRGGGARGGRLRGDRAG